ncbi:MAG TPA: YdeI/OmpD-associated family protein [Candidatus Acidoferrum sp.]|nr:YdeI/OmpD-associated family protein [Candidatus Acidoferrum sp.]
MSQADDLPSELVSAFKGNAAASTAFFALPPSHRLEYVKWIEEAKQPQTRLSRAQKTLEKLAPSGVKS